MIVCLCTGVSDRAVRLMVISGARSVDAVAACSGAGTDCGSCRHAIQDLIQDLVDDSGPASCSSLGGAPGDADASPDGSAPELSFPASSAVAARR
jgi:bacterioferritin-associated ferredoxin